MTSGFRSIVSVTISVAHSSRGHARLERCPPVHPPRGACLLANPLRGNGAHSHRRSPHHRPESRHLRRSRPRLYSHSLRRTLHGLGRALPDPRVLLAHSPSPGLPGPDRLGRPALDPGGGTTAPVRPGGDDLSRRRTHPRRAPSTLPPRRFSTRLLAQGTGATRHDRGWPRLLATRANAAEAGEAPHHLSPDRLPSARGGLARGRPDAGS